MLDLIWLIPLLPATGAALNGLLGIRLFGRRVAGFVACASMALALAVSALASWALVRLPADARNHQIVIGEWIPAIPLATRGGPGMFEVPWALRLDPLASVMILVVTGVGLLIHIYSTAYMHDEPRGGYARYFAYLNLFCFFMLALVLAGNFLVLFVGWEGVGLCSYLLIGFWYEKQSAANAGRKAFIVNRVGDWGFLLGIFLVFFTFGTLDFGQVAERVAPMAVETAGLGVLSATALLLLAGAAAKSAQLPLHVWLPDAMEGPTPVSALIHAATMVTAGVYVLARNAAVFSHAPRVMVVVAAIGAVTAVFAALIALAQHDIKRVLAYSTVSQLGYMFLAAGVGAFGAAIFHLFTHAFFKALLFLGSGSVIHAMAGEQDMRRMGGLRAALPITSATMLVGALAIAGIPPLAGFFSKDEILYGAFLGARPLWVLGLFAAGLSALYIFRLMAAIFLGAYQGPSWTPAASPAARDAASSHGVRHPLDAHAHGQAQRPGHDVTHGVADALAPAHAWRGPLESPRAMTIPMLLLAAATVVAGAVGLPPALGGSNALERFLEPALHVTAAAAAEPALAADAASGYRAELSLMLLSVTVALAGMAAARHLYVSRPELPARLAAGWPRLHSLLQGKFYVDELYARVFGRGTATASRMLAAFDRRVVDGAVNAVGWAAQIAAWISHMVDKHLVDGIVDGVGHTGAFGSTMLRRLQTGLVQNYALAMTTGVFALLTLYLILASVIR